MAKNRNKKKGSGVAPMDTAEPTLTDIPQGILKRKKKFRENNFPALILFTLHIR